MTSASIRLPAPVPQAARIAAENALMRERLSSVQAKTDDDIGDEAAGAARAAAAEKSKKRREEEQARLAEENRQFQERIKNTQAKTDDDVLDDEGGAVAQARAAAAASSKAKKEAAQAELDRQNAEMRERLDNVVAAVDDDISDEAAGMARDEYKGTGESGTPLQDGEKKKGFFGWG